MTRREGWRFVEKAAFVKGYEAKGTSWDIGRLEQEVREGPVVPPLNPRPRELAVSNLPGDCRGLIRRKSHPADCLFTHRRCRGGALLGATRAVIVSCTGRARESGGAALGTQSLPSADLSRRMDRARAGQAPNLSRPMPLAGPSRPREDTGFPPVSGFGNRRLAFVSGGRSKP